MRQTELISGIATGVRYTVHVSGDKDGVSTSHHTIFKVGDMTVMFRSAAPAIIGEGDRLIVAGRRKGRLLVADAYLNQTFWVQGNAGLWQNFAGMLIGLLFGGACFGLVLLWPLLGWSPLEQPWPVMLIVFGAIFCAGGLYCLYRWQHIRAAIKLLRAQR